MDNKSDIVLQLAADAGQLMLENGGETNRVEQICTSICRHFDMTDSDCFALPTGIMLSVKDRDGKVHTSIRRINKRNIDLHIISRIDEIVRTLNDKSSLKKIRALLLELRHGKQYPFILQVIAGGCIAGSFTLLFGGTLIDAAFSCPIGCIVRILYVFLSRIRFNYIFNNVIGGLITGAIAHALSGLYPGLHEDKIIIGSIMLLVPGLIIVNAVRDLIAGDLVAGAARLLEAFLIAVAIAAGTGISLLLWLAIRGGF